MLFRSDDIIKNYNLKFVDILHSDIQGAEVEMLQGAISAIKDKKIKYFFISTHGNDIHNFCLEFLKNNAYKIICSHDENESFSADGLIVASSDELEKEIKISKRGQI